MLYSVDMYDLQDTGPDFIGIKKRHLATYGAEHYILVRFAIFSVKYIFHRTSDTFSCASALLFLNTSSSIIEKNAYLR